MKVRLITFVILTLIFAQCKQVPEKTDDLTEIQQEVDMISDQLDEEFSQYRVIIEDLAVFTEGLYQNQDNYDCQDREIYKITSDSVLYKVRDDGRSAVFVSGAVPVDESVIDIVCFTEPLDSVFKTIIDTNDAIVQVYYNDKNSYNRIYPFFNALNQYEPGMNIPDYNFYYYADEKHNPEKNGVWVHEPYVDPAGRGWMVSAIAPVYYKDELVGVPGIDVTIKSLTDKYLSSDLPNLFIIDHEGVLVAADESVINILDLPELKDHKYFQTILEDTYRKDDFNLSKHKDKNVRNLFQHILNGSNDKHELQLQGRDYHLVYSEVKELEWFLIKLAE